MPVDDLQGYSLSQHSSGSSGLLSAEAREFIPKERQIESFNANGSSSDINNERILREKQTGAVPKSSSTFYKNNNQNNKRKPPRFNRHQNFDRYPKEESKFSENRKFYKDNYDQQNKNSRHYRQSDNWRSQGDNWNNEHYHDHHHKTNGAKIGQKKPNSSNNNKIKKQKSIEPSKISQREQIIKDIESNNLECMICCDKIKDYQSTWNCSNCYHIQHLSCIKTWISNSKTESGEWRCVACQYLRLETPKDYFCFCGKQKYPTVNRNDLAHSCGDQCGRTDNCQHPCTLRCHPGPHNICQSFVERSCGCGKLKKTFQCSMKEVFECDDICEKILNCGVHKCKDNCHQGPCSPCTKDIEMICYCEKDKKLEKCAPENVLVTKYSCGKVCDLQLECKVHRCNLICHSEKCSDCLLAPEFIKTCPCGKTIIEAGKRKSCSDPIPLCKSQCMKRLKCGPLASPHTCIKPCHLNECPPCNKTSNVKCRCGRIEEKIACKELINTDVRCKKKCTKFKNCGKHKCNQNCCIEIEHICSQQCGRMLECKKHRCTKPCHIGNCSPCPRVSFDELRCECGEVVVYPPVSCGVKVPECTKPCTRRHKCTHPVKHHCHTETDCPPCVFLTTKYCYGKHEQRKTIPCNQESFSCGMPCGKDLKCNRHKCDRKCHENACEKFTDICKQLCTTKRTECDHSCNAPCHEGKCPEKACKVLVEVTCSCGNLKEMKSCEQVAYENRKIHRVNLAMQMQQNGEGIDMKDIFNDGNKKTLKILECNNDCATLERNRRLDIAFKVENPNLINYPKFIPNYTDFIRLFYKKEPAFVNMVHEKLTDLVKLAKESKQKSRSHSFPVMNRDKRHVVHDLAAMFGVETQAFDAEPNRNVIATAAKESSWLPSMSIAEVIQRETGIRQVRPPTNQSWK
ncbi:CLUMA_CG014376, isoform A [Clunio marinus]|uniref:CLUMA_CG014376, isoform A n=1 Tax=Clunio marinus TaxID=568069 RepID=A0A1J1IMK6_9DIPT|nr:CLUMA_CG014376, isoform A [Clunio marinus]